MTNDIATVNPFQSMESFESAQRMAKALTNSTLIPAQYRGSENLGNALIALDMAQRMNMNPLAIMQHLYIVHGNPAWSAQFMISMFNQCGRFSPIRYVLTENNQRCMARCKELATGDQIDGPPVTIAMAKDEGWYDKRGSKWKTMPEHMLRLRSAVFLIRSTAPELTMGLHSVEEVRDIIDITPEDDADAGLAGAAGADDLPPANI